MKIKILLFLAVLSVLAGCVTQKKCNTKYPSSIDSIYKYVTRDSIIIRDTTIYITLPAETVHDSVKIPCPDPGPAYIPKKVFAETSLARAEAWWQYPNIQLRLTQKDTTIEERLRGTIIERNHYKSLYEKLSFKPEPVKYVPKFYKYCTLGFFASVIIFAVKIYIKYKVKILYLLKR